jgi:hypothetical protein
MGLYTLFICQGAIILVFSVYDSMQSGTKLLGRQVGGALAMEGCNTITPTGTYLDAAALSSSC